MPDRAEWPAVSRNCGKRLPAIDACQTVRAERVSVVWIEIERRLRLGGGSVEILLPEEEYRRDVMNEGDPRGGARFRVFPRGKETTGIPFKSKHWCRCRRRVMR